MTEHMHRRCIKRNCINTDPKAGVKITQSGFGFQRSDLEESKYLAQQLAPCQNRKCDSLALSEHRTHARTEPNMAEGSQFGVRGTCSAATLSNEGEGERQTRTTHTRASEREGERGCERETQRPRGTHTRMYVGREDEWRKGGQGRHEAHLHLTKRATERVTERAHRI